MDLNLPVSQERFGALVGISQPAVADLMRREVLREGQTAAQWLLAYTSKLREEAAGRSAGLLEERMLLDRARRVYQEWQNARVRRENAPVTLIEKILAQVGRRIGGILDRVPGRLRREVGSIDSKVMAIIEEEMARARNEAATLELPLDDIDGSLRDTPSDPQRPPGAGRAGADAAVAMG